MKKIISLFLMIMTMMASVCFAQPTTTADSDYVTITARGYGSNDASALEAAQVMGRHALLAQVKGVQITGDMTVDDGIMISSIVKQHVDGIIKGAETISINTIDPREKNGILYNGCEVQMRIPLYGPGSISDAVIANVPNMFTETPSIAMGQPMTNAEYTGVIIDCTDINISTAMCPAIVDQYGHVVYNGAHFSREQLINHGVVGYAKPSTSKARAGSNPIVIKAINVDKFVNPVIDEADALKLTNLDMSCKFFNSGKVIILRNDAATV